MEVVIQPTARQATQLAADRIAALIRSKPDATLGLATGRAPLELYRQLVAMQLDWRHVRTFNLDEYVGLPGDHPASFNRYMEEHLFRHVNIDRRNAHVPPGTAADLAGACARYEEMIRSAGGIDLQLLGIGTNGHIGFNEPTSSLASRTRIKTLTEDTRRANACHFAGAQQVPYHVITMGVATIMDARQCVLLAFGEAKATAVASAIEGPVSAMNPASVLQMHADTVLFLDEDAASRLTLAGYYRWVHEHKPRSSAARGI